MRKWLLLLSSLFCLAAVKPVFADQSCYIERSAAGDYTIPYTATSNVKDKIVNGAIPSPRDMGISFSYVLPLKGGDPIGCKSESPWNNGVNFTTSPELISTQYKGTAGEALFKTSVPGIYYSVTLICRTGDGCGTNHSDVVLPLLAPGGYTNSFPSQSGYPWETADHNWLIKINYWQAPDFKPAKGGTGHSLAGKVGTWRIGSPGQPEINIIITDSTLQFDFPVMTCDIGQLGGSAVSGNNVNLGTYFVSDIKRNSARAVPFTINTQNCNATIASIKMTSKYLPPAGVYNLLGKSAGSASGVAVKIMNTDYNVQMDPGGMVNVPYARSDDWTRITYFNFSAQVLGDGTPVKSGDFKTAATFILSYQ